MERKEYSCPSVEVIDVTSESSVICASFEFSDEEIDTGGRARGRRGSWGNLWEEERPQDNNPFRSRNY